MVARPLSILQLNCNKSTAVMHTLLNDPSIAAETDILVLQEPFTRLANPVSHHNWVCYGKVGDSPTPTTDYAPKKDPPPYPRVLIYVHKRISQADVDVVGHVHYDFMAIHLRLPPQPDDGSGEPPLRSLVIHNVYNPDKTHDSLPPFNAHYQSIQGDATIAHAIFGDFNIHHPWWEEGHERISSHATLWADFLSTREFELLTPADSPTWMHHDGSEHTNDLAFATPRVSAGLVACGIREGWNCGSDHKAVLTKFSMEASAAYKPPRFNMKRCDAGQLTAAVREEWESRWARLPRLSEDPEVWAEELQAAMVAGLRRTVPLARPCRHSKPWFSPEIAATRREMNDAEKRWKVTRSEVDRAAYTQTRNFYRNVVRQAKKDSVREALAQPEDAIWRMAKARQGNSRATLVSTLSSPGHPDAASGADKELRLRNAFFPHNANPPSAQAPAADDQPTEWTWRDLTAAEISRRIQSSKKDTAPGPDGIPWSAQRIVDAGWPAYSHLLQDIFNTCIKQGVHPRCYKMARTIILRKPNKPDYRRAGAYRPITLLSTTGKLLEALIARRALQQAESTKLLAADHYGGRPHRSTEDATLKMAQFVRDAHARKETVGVLAVDVSGAYNAVRPEPLLDDMRKSGWPIELQRWTASFLSQRQTQILVGDHLGPSFDSSGGLPQGSPVSQLLWLVYSRGLIESSQSAVADRPPLSVGWVDDWTVMAAGRTGREIASQLRATAHAAERWATSHYATFDADKSVSMIIQRPRADPINVGPIHLRHSVVRRTQSCRLLGVIFQETGQYHEHAADVAARATRSLGSLLQLGSRTWGHTYAVARKLYLAGIVPKFTHAASAWMPSKSSRGQARDTYLAQLEKVQRSAAVLITGAYRSSPNVALAHEASLLPVAEIFKQAHARQLIRLKSVPANHPLAKQTDVCCKRRRKRLVSPLQAIARDHDAIARAKIVRRLQARPPDWQPPNTSVAGTRRQALEYHRERGETAEQHADIYTDGSRGVGVGAAAVWERYGGWRVARSTLHSGSTVMQAEVEGMRLAVRMLVESAEQPQAVTIWSDSQAAVRAVGQATADGAAVRRVQDEILSMTRRGWGIDVRWLPGHSGIRGNEKADAEARRAGEQQAEAPEQGETATATLRGIARQEAITNWKAEFSKGRANGLKEIVGNDGEVGEVHKRHKGLTRAQSSLLTQLRTNHLGLNAYLKDRRVTTDPSCECGHYKETRQHLLLACPRWREERKEIVRVAGPRLASSTRSLLTTKDPKIIKAVAKLAAARFSSYDR